MYTSCSGRKSRQRKGKKGGRWTKIKEKKKKAYSLRDRRQNRDTRTFKDILAGQTDRQTDGLKCDISEQIQKHVVAFVSSSTNSQMGGVLPHCIKCRGKSLIAENQSVDASVWLFGFTCYPIHLTCHLVEQQTRSSCWKLLLAEVRFRVLLGKQFNQTLF